MLIFYISMKSIYIVRYYVLTPLFFFFSQSDSQNEESTEWKYMALGEREVHNQAIPDTGVKIFFVLTYAKHSYSAQL